MQCVLVGHDALKELVITSLAPKIIERALGSLGPAIDKAFKEMEL